MVIQSFVPILQANMFMHSIDDNRIYKVTKPAQIKRTEVQKGGVQKVDITFSTGNIHLPEHIIDLHQNNTTL